MKIETKVKTGISFNNQALGARISGCLLVTLGVLGLIPATSFASIPPGRALPAAAYVNADALANSDPSLVNGAFTQGGNQNDDRDDQNPGLFRPGSYGEWSAKWWQWLLQIPPAINPNFEGTSLDPNPHTVNDCAQGQSGPVWFLAGTFGGPAVRTCTVPAGVSLFFPILGTIFGAGAGDCLSPGWGNAGPCDVALLRAAAKAAEDNPATLELSIDGRPLTGLSAYRAQSPVFRYSLMSDNILSVLFNFPVPQGLYQPAVADGYWVMFRPLEEGNHTIHFRGVDAYGFGVDVTYYLTVRGRRHE